MNDKNQEMKIEIKVDESEATGRFSNIANIFHSPDEFVIDFLFVNPSPPPGFGKLVSRIILTPAHAKRIMHAITENVRKYEENFGEIRLAQPGEGGVNIQ
jgi:hypothetical protein